MRLHIELDDEMRAMLKRLPSSERVMMFKSYLDQLVEIMKNEARERLIDYLEDLQDTPGLEK